jgi:hypothetical protein
MNMFLPVVGDGDFTEFPGDSWSSCTDEVRLHGEEFSTWHDTCTRWNLKQNWWPEAEAKIPWLFWCPTLFLSRSPHKPRLYTGETLNWPWCLPFSLLIWTGW